MCRAFKINPRTYSWRLSQGWSQEKALTTPRMKDSHGTPKPITDFHGCDYPSIKRMLEKYGVKRGTYETRVHRKKHLKNVSLRVMEMYIVHSLVKIIWDKSIYHLMKCVKLII